MTEQYPKKIDQQPTSVARDYTQIKDVQQALERLISGLKEDGDEPRMFELLSTALNEQPEVVMAVVRGSIDKARQVLGQERRSGSSATLLYPVDAGVRVTARRQGILDEDPLSAGSWDTEKVLDVLSRFPNEVISLAGSNTTSKNLPQRAAHILWLLDQCTAVQTGQPLSFLEIGASGGLILDALRTPDRFRTWMGQQGYRTDYAQKPVRERVNPVLGFDLVKPDMDWLQAVILEDELRTETRDFITTFARSPVIAADATRLQESTEAQAFLENNRGTLPVIFSCFVFYQLDENTRAQATESARALLKQQGGGLLIISDIAKYRGFPEKAGGCVSWVENENGERLSPRIFLSKSTLTEWEEV